MLKCLVWLRYFAKNEFMVASDPRVVPSYRSIDRDQKLTARIKRGIFVVNKRFFYKKKSKSTNGGSCCSYTQRRRQFLVTVLRRCLYKSRDGTLAGTGRYSGPRHVYVSIIFITFLLYEAGTFFVPSRLGGILLSATGIPPQAGRFLSYKCFIPPDRDKLNFSF